MYGSGLQEEASILPGFPSPSSELHAQCVLCEPPGVVQELRTEPPAARHRHPRRRRRHPRRRRRRRHPHRPRRPRPRPRPRCRRCPRLLKKKAQK